MIDLSKDQLLIIKKILNQHIPNCEVRVFGSRVQGTAKKFSDIDLAVICEQAIPDKTLYALKDAFAESNLPILVDIVDWHNISESFQKIINQKYEPL